MALPLKLSPYSEKRTKNTAGKEKTAFYPKGLKEGGKRRREHLRGMCFFLFGGVCYVLLELCWRQYSHWTMFLCGGLCFFLSDILNNSAPLRRSPLWICCFAGASVITAVEFICGCIVNLWAHWDVWDYSGYRANLLGQICLYHSVLWFFLSAPILWISRRMRRDFENVWKKLTPH